ncbi:MAG: chemotaxis protein CheW [bacterium]|nr:chemotaxis protein CheW [bacterium]
MTTLTHALSATDANAGTREILSFRLGDEEYGIDILKVQEIRGYGTVTKIANTPEFIKGVIDLRGTIVPIVDMRLKFGLARAEYDQFTVTIILNVAERVVGIVVDGVSDVVALTPDNVKPIPTLGTQVDANYLDGVGTLDERMILLIDIERLMTSRDMQLVAAVTHAAVGG